MRIDIAFDFNFDTPPGKDADASSPTLRRYHQLLWSKPLPSGAVFTLAPARDAYLAHHSDLGAFWLSSDAITTNLTKQAAAVVAQVPPDLMPSDLGYTIGSSLLFPGNKVGGKMTINGRRGTLRTISDRFDLTLECIRRFYADETSPLAEVLERYADFFELFGHFRGYVAFFLLDDLLLQPEGERIRFFHDFEDFLTPAVPKTVEEYVRYVRASNAFIAARNDRIATYAAALPTA